MNDLTIKYTKTIIAKPFSILTCENNHPMFLTIKTLYGVHADCFAYPGVYFLNKLIDLDNAVDLYHCRKCNSSALTIDRSGISIFIRGKKTTIWPIDVPVRVNSEFLMGAAEALYRAARNK